MNKYVIILYNKSKIIYIMIIEKMYKNKEVHMSKVLENIISSKRLPTLFIGSGLSKRYLEDFPSWEQLLEKLMGDIKISKTAYAAKMQEIKSQNLNISRGKLNQKMATYLHSKLLSKIESDDIDLSGLFTDDEINKCTNDGVDYFKMLIAKRFMQYSLKQDKKNEIELFKKIGKKVSMVFTTNYDMFLEKEIFSDFKTYISQNKYYFRTNNGYGELFKIHGCINEPSGIIIDEKDYEKFDNSLKLISSKLINALLDYPVIFLGYSFEDENIKKIMTDFVNSFDDKILQEIKKFMVLVIFEEGQNELIEGEKQFSDEGTGKSITLTTISTDNFEKIYEYINRLQPCATAYELRKYKTMLEELVSKNAKGEKTIYVQEIENANLNAEAMYIGTKETIETITKSVDIYTNIDIIKKALNNETFNYDSFASKWYDNKEIKATNYTPVFLIKHKMTINYESTCEKFKNNYIGRKRYFEECFGEDNKKALKTCDDYDMLCNIYDAMKQNNKNYNSICSKLCPLLINSLYKEKISLNEFYELLMILLKEYPESITCSSFRKAACYYWYIKYEKK